MKYRKIKKIAFCFFMIPNMLYATDFTLQAVVSSNTTLVDARPAFNEEAFKILSDESSPIHDMPTSTRDERKSQDEKFKSWRARLEAACKIKEAACKTKEEFSD